jgi:hypothetical protein
MKKCFALLFIIVLLISCKSSKVLVGKYQIVSVNYNYIFDMNSQRYSSNNLNGNTSKGKFRIIPLSSQKMLIICNDLVFSKNADFIKELDKSSGDSINIGMYHSYKILGSTIFEIDVTNKDSLTFRKTYSNELTKTKDIGTLSNIK